MKQDKGILSEAGIRIAGATIEETMTGQTAARFAGVRHAQVTRK